MKLLSRVQLLATSWTAAYQAPPSMGFSRQEYWSGVPLPSPLAVFCKSPLGSCKSRKPRALPDFHALFLFPSSVCSSSKLCCHNSVVRPLASENRIPQGRCHRFRIIPLSGENKELKATLFSSICESEVLVTRSGPTLCDPVDCSPPGSYVQGILQARVLEWVTIPYSRGPSRPRDLNRVSCIA